MVKVSELAAGKLKEIIAKEKHPEETMLRISFGGFGWGGPRLQLTLDEFMNENDILAESEGIKVVYNSGIEGQVHNALVDYSNNWFERGFVIRGTKVSSC